MKKVTKVFCLGMAFLCLTLGAAGMVLPIVPTTPFLLLAAALFAKSSGRFHRWFVRTKLYQKYVEQAFRKKAMTRETKRRTMCVLGTIFLIGFLFTPVWYAKAVIAVIAAGHLYYFLAKIKTVAKEEE